MCTEDAARVTTFSGRCLDWKQSAARLVTSNEAFNPKVTTATDIAPETQRCEGCTGIKFKMRCTRKRVYQHQNGVYGIRDLLSSCTLEGSTNFSGFFFGFSWCFFDLFDGLKLSLCYFFDSRDFS